MRHWLVIGAALLLVAAPCGAATGGGNIGFLKDAPITRFKGTDLKMFQSNLADALEQNADGSTRRWTNTETGSSGEIEVINSFTEGDQRCRRARITNRAQGYAEARTDAAFCKDAHGQWKAFIPKK
jgi:surface antigen